MVQYWFNISKIKEKKENHILQHQKKYKNL